jgi:hypothetical protein
MIIALNVITNSLLFAASILAGQSIESLHLPQ